MKKGHARREVPNWKMLYPSKRFWCCVRLNENLKSNCSTEWRKDKLEEKCQMDRRDILWT